jgi:hypothetical protein
LDVRQALLATIKMSACCVVSAKRRHDLAVLNVKIVVLADMVLIVKNANLVNIVPLRLMILRPVPHAVLGGINQTQDKQAAFHAHQENINMLKER